MMASLYQSGSSSRGKPSGSDMGSALLLPQDMRRHLIRPQLDIITGTLPGELRAGYQVQHAVRPPRVNAQFLEGKLQESGLLPNRIQIDNSDNDVPVIWCSLAVGNELLVVDRMEAETVVRLQRRILLPNRVHPRDEGP